MYNRSKKNGGELNLISIQKIDGVSFDKSWCTLKLTKSGACTPIKYWGRNVIEPYLDSRTIFLQLKSWHRVGEDFRRFHS
jgi:hypothetical protein